MKILKNKFAFRTILFGTGIFAFTACFSDSGTKVMKLEYPAEKLVFDQLVGTWKSEDGKSFERWSRYSDGTYHSSVYMLKGKDTVFTEQAEVYKENGHWIFENTVAGQNEGEKIRFTSAEINGNKVQFLNPAHDFPNEIHYSLPDQNTVNAFIVGKNEKGGTDTIPFNYTRI